MHSLLCVCKINFRINCINCTCSITRCKLLKFGSFYNVYLQIGNFSNNIKMKGLAFSDRFLLFYTLLKTFWYTVTQIFLFIQSFLLFSSHVVVVLSLSRFDMNFKEHISDFFQRLFEMEIWTLSSIEFPQKRVFQILYSSWRAYLIFW